MADHGSSIDSCAAVKVPFFFYGYRWTGKDVFGFSLMFLHLRGWLFFDVLCLRGRLLHSSLLTHVAAQCVCSLLSATRAWV